MTEQFLRQISVWFIIFILYSFAGWICELISIAILHKKIYNRGFLIGPICPIYGVGAVLGSLIISPDEGILEIFCVCAFFAGFLEYFTSLIMEHLFHARWWDYSDYKFNINGRVCLRNILLFGIMGIFIIKLITPFLLSALAVFNDVTIYSVALALGAIFLFDVIFSLYIIIRFRIATNLDKGDATEEITERIRKIFLDQSWPKRRLVKAYPKLAVTQPAKKSTQKSRKNSSRKK